MIGDLRVRAANTAPIRTDGEYVLYWMTAARRIRYNPALERAVGHARSLGRPLVVLEALRVDYPFASDRLHRFVLDGMADNAARFRKAPVTYHPYVERERGAGRGLLEALAARASIVVADEWPSFFHPRMLGAAAGRLDVRVEAVDGNGLLPLRATDRVFARAYDFRRWLAKALPPHLRELPKEDPLRGASLPPPVAVPDAIARRWPAGTDVDVAGLPIDHDVPAVDVAGGGAAGRRRLRTFVAERLPRYDADRNRPEEEVTSGLSPYLHFGHVSSFEIHRAVADAEGAEGFVDQLVTWRELGFNMSSKVEGHDEYDSLPGWAQATLAEHAGDPRDHLYSRDEFEAAATHDELWNAAQRQLRREGAIHNYLRMLWGKKILEWSRTPEEALATMLRLNDRWALDGRDPNSVSGIFWCLGRYDRAWGPERPVFGKVRWMSSANTARKVRVKGYLERYGPEEMLW